MTTKTYERLDDFHLKNCVVSLHQIHGIRVLRYQIHVNGPERTLPIVGRDANEVFQFIKDNDYIPVELLPKELQDD